MVTAIFCAVALLPVDSILVDAPVAHSGNAGLRYRGASSDHLAPSAVPDESSGALLDHLHAKRSRHVRFIAVALDGDILRSVECFVCTAIVHPLGICLRGTLVATYGESCKINSSSIERNEF